MKWIIVLKVWYVSNRCVMFRKAEIVSHQTGPTNYAYVAALAEKLGKLERKYV